MKAIIASDIHGSLKYTKKLEELIQKYNPDKIILLGDLLYHGARNSLPNEYNTMGTCEILNKYSEKIIAVRGNCDSEVDVMVSDFPIINELGILSINGKDIYLTHGHIYNENNWPKNNSILVYGHLHTPFIKEKDGNIYLNTGSISLPKSEEGPTYLVLEDDKFVIYNIKNEKVLEKQIF